MPTTGPIFAATDEPARIQCTRVRPGVWATRAAAYRKNSLESAAAVPDCTNLHIERVGTWKRGRATSAAGLQPRAIKSKSCGLSLPHYVSPLQWAL